LAVLSKSLWNEQILTILLLSSVLAKDTQDALGGERRLTRQQRIMLHVEQGGSQACAETTVTLGETGEVGFAHMSGDSHAPWICSTETCLLHILPGSSFRESRLVNQEVALDWAVTSLAAWSVLPHVLNRRASSFRQMSNTALGLERSRNALAVSGSLLSAFLIFV
jgi:hypothetical protein